VEEQGNRIGVIVQEETGTTDQHRITCDDDLILLKRNEDLKSLWLVIVSTSLQAGSKVSDVLTSKLPPASFDHIFSFNFFAKQVYQFK